MKRTLFVIVLAASALALLVGAALKSQSVPLEVHIAHYTLTAEVARLDEDVRALLTSLETAWQSGLAPGEAAAALHRRIVAVPASVERSAALIPGGTLERQRINNQLEQLKSAMTTVDVLASELLKQQSDYAASLAALRDRGPEAVRELRAASRLGMAEDLFGLMAGAIDYAAPGPAPAEPELRRLLASLNRDQRLELDLPAATGELLSAAALILDTKQNAQSRLDQLGGTPVIEIANGLGAAATAAYQGAVASTDGARTMLSIYAVVMLLGIGLIGFRLSRSYRELNRANTELAVLNESLEQRVAERTSDLEGALADLKESQVQLVQAEKMSSLGQLVAGISHEINTPLLYLSNNASLIQERIEPLREFVRQSARALNPPKRDEHGSHQKRIIEGLRTLKILLRENELEASIDEVADLTQDCVEGLADLTEMAQSLKDFSRLDRAPVGSFDVNAGLDKTLTIARNIVKDKAKVRKLYGELPPVECSPSKINQVFLNLITNAAQAMDGHGEIVIATKRRGDDRIVISIADTGCGIPEEDLGKIRDPFFTTKAPGTGTGLGLSIVDEIVRSHGGELIVESKVGVGSTFSIVLPIRQPEAPLSEPEADADADADAGGPREEPGVLAEAV